MPTTLTLKNIPDHVYEQLKRSAALHRRSLNSEAIVCLEAALVPVRRTTTDQLARIREIRASLPQDAFAVDEMDALKKKGRL